MDKIRLGFNKEQSTFVSDPQMKKCLYSLMCHITVPRFIAGLLGEKFFRRLIPVKACIFHEGITNRMDIFFWIEGTATCHGDDIFNETIGHRISENKAKRNAYRVLAKISRSVLRQLDRYREDTVATKEWFDFLLEDSDKHISNIINGIEE